MTAIPLPKLIDFLMSKAVSGGNSNFRMDQLLLIDSTCLFLCCLSKAGSTEKELIGMRIVGYLPQLKAAVLNLTVVFEDHREQRNLDPINKLTYSLLQQPTQ